MIEIQNTSDCYLRLPCGICRLTMTDCPKVSEVYSITTTWVTTNCEVNSTGTGQREVTT